MFSALARRLNPLTGLLLAAFLGSGCDRKDPEKCQQALTVTQQALAGENIDLAKQWRNYAYGQCSDPAQLTQLDQTVVSKQNEMVKRAQEATAAKQASGQLLKVFTNWVAAHQKSPQTASAAPTCPPNDEKGDKAKERWCVATRRAGPNHVLEAHYWEAEPEAVRFTTRLPEPIKCDDLGPNTVLKTLSVPTTSGSSATRQHCQLSAGSLAGLQALVTEANNAELHIFSSKYLERDAAMKTRVGG